MTQVLLTLVRTLFGFFIGGFLGASIGMIIELVVWVEKGGAHPPMEDIVVSTIFGALIGALMGFTHLFNYRGTSEKLPKDENPSRK